MQPLKDQYIKILEKTLRLCYDIVRKDTSRVALEVKRVIQNTLNI